MFMKNFLTIHLFQKISQDSVKEPLRLSRAASVLDIAWRVVREAVPTTLLEDIRLKIMCEHAQGNKILIGAGKNIYRIIDGFHKSMSSHHIISTTSAAGLDAGIGQACFKQLHRRNDLRDESGCVGKHHQQLWGL